MFLKTKSLKGRLFSFSVSLILINLLCAFIFLTFVAAHFYRKQDQDQLKTYAQSLVKVYKTQGLDQVYREEFLWIQVKDQGQVIFQQYPRKLEKSDREILATNKLEFGFQSIDLSEGDEILDRFVGFLMKEKFYTLASLLNDDFFDVYVVRIDESKVLAVGRDGEDREEMLQDLRFLMTLSFIPALILAVIMSFLMGRFFLRPIDELIKSFKKGKVSLDENKAPTEIVELKDEFNKLYLSLKGTLDNVAHDLKTPLTHLKLNSEEGILQDEDIASLKNRLGENMEAADTILNILKSLMDVKEAESGAMFMQQHKIELDKLILKVIDMHAYSAEEKKIKITSSLASLGTQGDETRLYQVFSNLLDNALKYSHSESRVQIKLYQDGMDAVIEFQDEGQGVSAEDLERIWDRLYRGDKGRSTPGLGIGLSLVKAYVEAHKGRVSVKSVPNQGSQFFVRLPICHF